jgi:small subunit ribosomal protein S8
MARFLALQRQVDNLKGAIFMTMQDPIADMFVRLRNGQSVKNEFVSMPSSKIKVKIAKILQEEGYINGYELLGDLKKQELKIALKYFKDKPVIDVIKRISKPSLRVYCASRELPKVLGGLGIVIVSTSRGLMTDKEARLLGEGGEIICHVA